MLISMEMIYNKLCKTEQILEQMLKENEQNSIEEISLNKAAKLLHKGTDWIIRQVQSGKLSAIKYRDKKHRTRYRFRISDIKNFQTSRINQIPVYSGPTSEEICDSIFNNKIRKDVV